jgi:hypothetical protein
MRQRLLFALCVLLLCAGCSVLCAGCSESSVRSSPGEILKTVTIPDPSILGYVRVDAAGISALLQLVDSFRSDLDEMPGSSFLTRSLPIDMISRVASLAALGSHMTVLFLDPGTFGGGAALHFVPERRGSLVELLDADPLYERLGDSPPEFRMVRDRDVGTEILAVLRRAGFDIEIPGGEFNQRFLVEEDSEKGVLVLPSFDARRDVKAFLKSTDYLSPWADALFVIDLDVSRLGFAYADLLRSIDTSIRKIAAIHDAGAKTDAPLTPGRILRFWSVTVFGCLGGLEGVRFASSRPGGVGAELRLKAVEGSGVDRVLQCLRERGPSMTGVIPGVFSLQLNGDPVEIGGLLRDAKDFYSENLDIRPDLLEPVTEACVRSFSSDRGTLLYGAGFFGDGLWGAGLSQLKEGVDPDVVGAASRDVWDGLAGLLGHEMKVDSFSGWGDFSRYDLFPFDVTIESGVAKAWSLSMIRTTGEDEPLGKPGGLSVKILRLAGIGVPAGRSLPRSKHLYVRYSVIPASDGLFPTVGMLLPLNITGHGYGSVKGSELVVTFPRR